MSRVLPRALLRPLRGAGRSLAEHRRGGPPTALVVTVPESAELHALRASHVPEARVGMPAHVTALTPFVRSRRVTPDVARELAAVCATVQPFPVRFTSVGHFLDVTYLAPEDPAPFVTLTERLHRQWPDHPPFGGAFAEVVPHLTVAEGPHEVAAVTRAAQSVLPLAHHVDGLTVLAQGWDRRWRAVRYLPFGESL